MFRRRRQATRLGTRVARSAVRTAKAVVRQARGAFTAGAVGGAAYKAGKKVARYTKRKIGISESAPGNDWSVTKRRVGRKKPNTVARLSRMLEVGMCKNIYRFQGLTNFDTNVGYYHLANVQYPTGTIDIPIHIYDLTSFPNTTNAPVCYNYLWSGTAATADIIRGNRDGQTPNGTLTANWNTENGNPNAAFPNSRVMRHDWTDIRLNLYGARKRTTRFDVMFIRVKDEFANPLIANVSNPAIKELFAYLERPCVFSNLQTYQTNVAKKIQIVKKFTYWVSASQTTDVDTAVGKIKEARIFMRHDKIYSLDWRHEGIGTSTVSHVQTEGANYVQDLSHHNNPWHGSRLMMVIRAFAPERSYPSGAFTPDANRDPTYDVLIRNQISTPF